MEYEAHLLPEYYIHVHCYFVWSNYLKMKKLAYLGTFTYMYLPYKYWSVLQIVFLKDKWFITVVAATGDRYIEKSVP